MEASRRNTGSEVKAEGDSRVEKSLEFAETISAQELVPALEKEAAELIGDPFAFALAGVLDRGTKAELIWTIPYYTKKASRRIEPVFLCHYFH